ncbi:lipopolysaccharide biosynthesis protein [Polaromonas hydrogenivorans]|uniref:Oligosaccharide flippase family protein n=1 Tax=Polaromonas hydrogenivorans TaxID=335476 RepID=A0AAU7LUE8_9BURK
MKHTRKLYAQGVGIVTSALHHNHGSFIASSAAVQLLPLISAPIVSRLYSPTAFGAYAVFYALVVIIGSVASLAFHNAILLEEDDRAAVHAALLSFAATVATSAVLAMALFAMPEYWLRWAVGADTISILPLLPLTVMTSSGYMSLYTWCIRKGYYQQLARNKVILGVSTMLIQVSIGLMRLEAVGFVLANLLGYVLANFLLYRLFHIDISSSRPDMNFGSIKAQLKKYKELPLYSVPATLLNTLSSQLPEFMINKLFGAHQLGQYSLANRMVNMPLSFLASSIYDIFRQKASTEFTLSGSCKVTYGTFLALMILISVVLLVPTVLIVPELFPLIFGKQWNQSGYLIRVMVFLLAVRFISSPLSYIWIIRGKQKMDFLWQIGLFVISAAAFVFSHILFQSDSLPKALFMYSTMAGFWYAFCIYISFKYSK